MTVGVDDIGKIVILCKCGIRLSLSPDEICIPENCPSPNCGIAWSAKPSHVVSSDREVWASATLNFADAIGQMRKHLKNSNFTILLEFDTPTAP